MRLFSDYTARSRGRAIRIGQAPPFVWVVFSFLLFLALPHSAISAGISADAVVLGTNTVRTRFGHPSLRVDPHLSSAAQQRAAELVAANTFAHTRPDGAPFATAATDAGYPFERVAENLAIDFLQEQPVFDAWLESPSHRRNFLGPQYRDIGVGVASGVVRGIPTTIVVQLLGNVRQPNQRGWTRLSSALAIG